MGVAYERICVRRVPPPSSAGLAFGGSVVRLASGGEVEDAERERVMAYLRMMDVPLPSKVDAATSLEYARLYDSLQGVVSVIREQGRRERKRLAVVWSVFAVVSVSAFVAVWVRYGYVAASFVGIVSLLFVRGVLRRDRRP